MMFSSLPYSSLQLFPRIVCLKYISLILVAFTAQETPGFIVPAVSIKKIAPTEPREQYELASTSSLFDALDLW